MRHRTGREMPADYPVVAVPVDPAAMPQASRALVNDLDLRVTSPDNNVHLGNDLANRFCIGDDCRVWQERDATNNVESVRLSGVAAGEHLVREHLVQVIGHDVPSGPQKFALVVTGGNFTVLEGTACSHISGCGVEDCGSFGSCLMGMCQCEPTHSGPLCQHENHVLARGSAQAVARVQANSWVYFVWHVDAAADWDRQKWELKVEFVDATQAWVDEADPDLYLAFNRQPSLDDWDARYVEWALSEDAILASDIPIENQHQGGVMVLGVYAFCCADVHVKVTLTLPMAEQDANGSSESPSTPCH